MSFKNHWTISSSCDFQAHQQRSQRRCFSQTALLGFKVPPDMSLVLPELSPALPGARRIVVGPPSYSEGRQEFPPRVWYSHEIDSSKFTLHILSDTPGGFQWLKYILLIFEAPWELTSKHRVKQTQNVLWSVIGRILDILLGSVLTSILRAYLGAYNDVYWVEMLNAAWCIVSSAQNCIHIIAMESIVLTMGPSSDRKTTWVTFQNHPKTWTAAS